MGFNRTVAFVLCALLGAVSSFHVQAGAFDERVAFDAWRAIGMLEYQEKIPRGLLHSMSLVETGSGIGDKMLPWPYTIRVNSSTFKTYKHPEELLFDLDNYREAGFRLFSVLVGEERLSSVGAGVVDKLVMEKGLEGETLSLKAHGYAERFGGLPKAVSYVEELLSRGFDNIDIGVMQINWHFHGDKFSSLAHAFDPYQNASYAASYLMQHKSSRSWWGSVGRYHSGRKEYARRYVESVWEMYRKVRRFAGDI